MGDVVAVVSEASITKSSHPQLENFYFSAKDIFSDINSLMIFKKTPCEILKLLLTQFLFNLRLMFPSVGLHYPTGNQKYFSVS